MIKFVFIFCGFFALVSCSVKKNTIIFIVSSSSVGKTTVVNELKKKLAKDWVKISDDDLDEKVFSNYPSYDNNYIPNDILYDIRQKDGTNKVITGVIWDKMALKVVPYSLLAFLDVGFNVINDSLVFNLQTLELYRKLFINHNSIFVYLYADLKVIEKREQKRGNRFKGSAKTWLATMTLQDYCDVKIDTTNLNIEQVAGEIIVKL